MILSRGSFGQHVPQLHLGCAVAARRFDVVDAEFNGAVDGGLEVFLVLPRNVLRIHVLPLELVAHPPQEKTGIASSVRPKRRYFIGAKISDPPTRGKQPQLICD